MASARITKRTVDEARAAGGKRLLLWDQELAGFGLKVTPSGVKSYVFQYRVGGGRRGRQRMITIGRHGAPWTPDQARREALRLLGEITRGGDPLSSRTTERQAPTLAEFSERYLSEHADVHKTPRSAAEDRRTLAKHVLPALGSIKLKDITSEDLRRFHLARRETPIAANRALALMSHMFTFARDHGLIEGNPASGIKRFKEERRNRFLSEAELARLGDALAQHREKFYGPVAQAIRLLAFTGARLSEILTLKWDYLDWEHGLARLPRSKTGPKVIYLNPPALDTLSELPRIAGNPYVLPGRRAGEHLTAVGLQHAWRMVGAAAGLEGARLHDLRHSFASFGAAGGMGLPVIGALLGHARAATTERYAHLSADPLRRASEAIAVRIARAMRKGKSHDDENNMVLELRKEGP